MTYVLPVIDRSSNDQHQCVIDVLSLFLLLMLSLDGATGLPETWCVRVCECSGAYLCLIFLFNRVGVYVCVYRCVWMSSRCECGC